MYQMHKDTERNTMDEAPSIPSHRNSSLRIDATPRIPFQTDNPYCCLHPPIPG